MTDILSPKNNNLNRSSSGLDFDETISNLWINYPSDSRKCYQTSKTVIKKTLFTRFNHQLITKRWVYDLGPLFYKVNIETLNPFIITQRKRHILLVLQEISIHNRLGISEYHVLKAMLINTILDLRKTWNISIYMMWLEDIYLHISDCQKEEKSVIVELNITFLQQAFKNPYLDYKKKKIFGSELLFQRRFEDFLQGLQSKPIGTFKLQKMKPRALEENLEEFLTAEEFLERENLLIDENEIRNKELNTQLGQTDINLEFNQYIIDNDSEEMVHEDLNKIMELDDYDSEEFEYQYD